MASLAGVVVSIAICTRLHRPCNRFELRRHGFGVLRTDTSLGGLGSVTTRVVTDWGGDRQSLGLRSGSVLWGRCRGCRGRGGWVEVAVRPYESCIVFEAMLWASRRVYSEGAEVVGQPHQSVGSERFYAGGGAGCVSTIGVACPENTSPLTSKTG